jgi:hypothetical protein
LLLARARGAERKEEDERDAQHRARMIQRQPCCRAPTRVQCPLLFCENNERSCNCSMGVSPVRAGISGTGGRCLPFLWPCDVFELLGRSARISPWPLE